MESIKVVVRCRPFNKREKDNNFKSVLKIFDNSVCIKGRDSKEEEKTFSFDAAFDENSTQV